MVQGLLVRCVFIVCAIATGLSLYLALKAGCDLATAILRATFSACMCVWLGLFIARPLAAVLRPLPKSEKDKDVEETTPDATNAAPEAASN